MPKNIRIKTDDILLDLILGPGYVSRNLTNTIKGVRKYEVDGDCLLTHLVKSDLLKPILNGTHYERTKREYYRDPEDTKG